MARKSERSRELGVIRKVAEKRIKNALATRLFAVLASRLRRDEDGVDLGKQIRVITRKDPASIVCALVAEDAQALDGPIVPQLATPYVKCNAGIMGITRSL